MEYRCMEHKVLGEISVESSNIMGGCYLEIQE